MKIQIELHPPDTAFPSRKSEKSTPDYNSGIVVIHMAMSIGSESANRVRGTHVFQTNKAAFVSSARPSCVLGMAMDHKGISGLNLA